MVTHLLGNEEKVLHHNLRVNCDRQSVVSDMRRINSEDFTLEHLDRLLSKKNSFKAQEDEYIPRNSMSTPSGE